jgi:hypothetical protein
MADGKQEEETLTVTNGGSAPLHIDRVAIEGPDSDAFKIQSDRCGGQLVAVHGKCTVTVRFGPRDDTAVERHAVLSLTNDAAGSPHEVSLHGLHIGQQHKFERRMQQQAIKF